MIDVRYQDLPASARAGFAAATIRPIAFERALGAGRFSWIVLFGSLLPIVGLGYFLVDEGGRTDPFHEREIYALFAVAVFVGAGTFLGFVLRWIWSVPYRQGLYVLSSAFVRTDGDLLTIIPFTRLHDAPTVETSRFGANATISRVKAGGDFRFTYTFAERSEAERVAREVVAARERLLSVTQSRDVESITRLDPFAECTLADRWPPIGGARPPAWASLVRWSAAFVIAATMAIGLYVAVDLAFALDRAALDDLRK